MVNKLWNSLFTFVTKIDWNAFMFLFYVNLFLPIILCFLKSKQMKYFHAEIRPESLSSNICHYLIILIQSSFFTIWICLDLTVFRLFNLNKNVWNNGELLLLCWKENIGNWIYVYVLWNSYEFMIFECKKWVKFDDFDKIFVFWKRKKNYWLKVSEIKELFFE